MGPKVFAYRPNRFLHISSGRSPLLVYSRCRSPSTFSLLRSYSKLSATHSPFIYTYCSTLSPDYLPSPPWLRRATTLPPAPPSRLSHGPHPFQLAAAAMISGSTPRQLPPSPQQQQTPESPSSHPPPPPPQHPCHCHQQPPPLPPPHPPSLNPAT